MSKKQKCEQIASYICDKFAHDKKYTYGDVLGGLELARLWIFSHYMSETLCDCEESNVDTIEVSKSGSKDKSNRVTPTPEDLGSLWSDEK